MTGRMPRFAVVLSLALCAALCAQESELKLISYLDARSLAWMKDGSMYAAGGEDGAGVWSAETDEEVIPRVEQPVRYVMFNDVDRLFCLDNTGKAAAYNIDPAETERMTLFDSVTTPIQTMTAGHTRFAVSFSHGDGAIIEGSQLLPTDEAVIKDVMQLSGRITHITANTDAQRLIAVTDDDRAMLVNMQSWSVIQTYDFTPTGFINETDGSIVTYRTPLPQITDSGLFVLPDADGGLMLYGGHRPLRIVGNDIYAITAYALSESGHLLATADGTGMIRVVNMDDGHVIATASLTQDVAISMAMSPLQDSIIIGTQGGVLYRWEFAPPGTGEDDAPNDRPRDSINLSLGYLKIQKNYFVGAFSLQSGWRSYQPDYVSPWLANHNFTWLAKHFYYGVDAGLGLGFPSSKYPYFYQNSEGKLVPEPYEWELFAASVAGIFQYKKDYDLTLFAELMLGFNAHLLFNNNFANPHTSKFDPAIYTGIALGVQWRRVRASFDIVYDTNFQMRLGGRVGLVIPIKRRKRNQQ